MTFLRKSLWCFTFSELKRLPLSMEKVLTLNSATPCKSGLFTRRNQDIINGHPGQPAGQTTAPMASCVATGRRWRTCGNGSRQPGHPARPGPIGTAWMISAAPSARQVAGHPGQPAGQQLRRLRPIRTPSAERHSYSRKSEPQEMHSPGGFP
jgi:hypothetical protein